MIPSFALISKIYFGGLPTLLFGLGAEEDADFWRVTFTQDRIVISMQDKEGVNPILTSKISNNMSNLLTKFLFDAPFE